MEKKLRQLLSLYMNEGRNRGVFTDKLEASEFQSKAAYLIKGGAITTPTTLHTIKEVCGGDALTLSVNASLTPLLFDLSVRTGILLLEIALGGAVFADKKVQQMYTLQRPLGLTLRFTMKETDVEKQYALFLAKALAYQQSARIADRLEPFYLYDRCEQFMQSNLRERVKEMQAWAKECKLSKQQTVVLETAWNDVLTLGKAHGFRHAKVLASNPLPSPAEKWQRQEPLTQAEMDALLRDQA